MNEGWKCPVCGRGVAPTEKHCNHDATGVFANPVIVPSIWPTPFTTGTPIWNPPPHFTTWGNWSGLQ